MCIPQPPSSHNFNTYQTNSTQRYQLSHLQPTMTLFAKRASKVTLSSTNHKKALINKFLSKTFHMLELCNPDVASWSSGGDTFTVKDIVAFENELLPKYFNHSHFSSFTRQLNFYGFQKRRADSDLQLKDNNSVRFCHEFFRRGHPELLQNIQRATAGATASKVGPTSSVLSTAQVDTLQQQVKDLKKRLEDFSAQHELILGDTVSVMTQGHEHRLKEMEAKYQNIIFAIMLQRTGQTTKVPELHRSFGLHQLAL